MPEVLPSTRAAAAGGNDIPVVYQILTRSTIALDHLGCSNKAMICGGTPHTIVGRTRAKASSTWLGLNSSIRHAAAPTIGAAKSGMMLGPIPWLSARDRKSVV